MTVSLRGCSNGRTSETQSETVQSDFLLQVVQYYTV